MEQLHSPDHEDSPNTVKNVLEDLLNTVANLTFVSQVFYVYSSSKNFINQHEDTLTQYEYMKHL